MNKFQCEIDNESLNRAELARMEREMSDPKQRDMIRMRIEKSDDKIQSLALLMLHYCAGLQHCLDQQEEQRQRPPTAPAVPAAAGGVSTDDNAGPTLQVAGVSEVTAETGQGVAWILGAVAENDGVGGDEAAPAPAPAPTSGSVPPSQLVVTVAPPVTPAGVPPPRPPPPHITKTHSAPGGLTEQPNGKPTTAKSNPKEQQKLHSTG